jgi:hypothetical protein
LREKVDEFKRLLQQLQLKFSTCTQEEKVVLEVVLQLAPEVGMAAVRADITAVAIMVPAEAVHQISEHL